MNKNGKASVLEVTAIGNFYQKKKADERCQVFWNDFLREAIKIPSM